EQASHRARVINHAVGLTALEHDNALDRPPIRDFTRKGISRNELRQFIVIIDVEDVRALDVRRAVTVTQVELVVSIVKQTQGALLVQRAGKCVGNSPLESMAEALFDVRLERVVSRYPDRGVGLGLTRVSNVRNSQVDI